jgi:flagellar basal-body rod protein FlgB
MSSDLFRGVDAQRRALDFHLSRHNVLASNLANAETPGFRPLELLREQDKGDGAVPMSVSNEGHFPTNGSGATEQYSAREDQTAAPGANGNAVSLEHEMSKLAANDIRFEGAVKIVAQQLAMLRYAANDGTGG